VSRPFPQAEINRAVAELLDVDARRGTRITIVNFVVVNTLLALSFWVDSMAAFVGFAVVNGIFYMSVMSTSHDAIHHTLTGRPRFDEIVPRAFSYFIFWPHGVYAELHKLHHKLNGKDLDDPEIPTFTAEAWASAGPVKRWLIRHDWWLSLFVYGGAGMIFKHVYHAFKWRQKHERMRWALWTDAVGIGLAVAVMLAVVIPLGMLERYVVYILILERIIGFGHQLRLHIEHYGLHGDHGGLLETRLYNCRNINTSWLPSRMFNGLNFHSVHHAWPRIPFYHLKTAHERVAAICAAAGRPLPEGDGYIKTAIALTRNPILIADPQPVALSEAS
jgi:fatty acid desaturase